MSSWWIFEILLGEAQRGGHLRTSPASNTGIANRFVELSTQIGGSGFGTGFAYLGAAGPPGVVPPMSHVWWRHFSRQALSFSTGPISHAMQVGVLALPILFPDHFLPRLILRSNRIELRAEVWRNQQCVVLAVASSMTRELWPFDYPALVVIGRSGSCVSAAEIGR